ncbi:MAG: glycosyltransferase [Desulfobacterales bacterium]|nr:glycosyltransferase [Desulfobacterales bacterium]
MRVIQIVPAITNEASGPSYTVVRLCENLIANGLGVTLAALDWAPMASAPSFLQTFPLGWGPRRLGRSPAMQSWLHVQGKSNSVDLIHDNSLWMMPNVYPGQVARRYDIPLVVTPHGTLSEWAMQSGSSFKRLFWPLLQRPALAATTCFNATAVSEYEDIRRMGFRQPVAVIPNGIDIPPLLPKAEKDHRTLLFLGRIHPIKGLDILFHAWRAVQDRFSEWRLRIVGPDNGGYLGKIKGLACAMHLERIEFSGALFGELKWQAYRDADLFVLPTHSENFGISVAEALVSGTPAIVSKGAPWAGLNSRQSGWWIDIGINPLVACLEQALSESPAALTARGSRGRDWMQTEYSWAHVGWQMAATYRWILNGGNKPEWIIED